MGWIVAKLCKGGVTLRDQIDRRWPRRDKKSDGWIGDEAHNQRISDHVPNDAGVVRAIDIDENLGTMSNGGTARILANQLIDYAASGLPGSNRLKYVVYENRIASGTYRKTWFSWRHGNWGHTAHIHISFTSYADRDGSIYPLPILARSPLTKARWTRDLAKARKLNK
jgi:hypothetical protein